MQLTTEEAQMQTAEKTRSRTVTWDDPLISARAVATASGLDVLKRLESGALPAAPVARLLGMEPIEVTRGRVVFSLEPGEYHYNPIGSVHGGVLATLLDSAMGCAVHSTLPEASGYTTLDINVNFIRRVTVETGPLRCEGEIVHAGRTVATARGRIVDHNGVLYAHATTTCLIIGGSR